MASNNVVELINQLYQMIDDAKSAFGGGCKIDRDKALDILDEMRDKFPGEIEQARRIVSQGNDYITQAKNDAERIVNQAREEGDRIIRHAEEEADRRLEQNELQQRLKAKMEEVMQETQKRSYEMIRSAQEQANEVKSEGDRYALELKGAARAYCDDTMRRSEEALVNALNEVRRSRAQFQQVAGGGAESASRSTMYDAAQDEE